MDFRNVKRKELQALCKKHGVPANLSNLEMANRLSLLFKEKRRPLTQGRSCLKDLGESGSENSCKDEIRRVKKVRFSPENQTFEFVDLEIDTGQENPKTRLGRRHSMLQPLAIENCENVQPFRGDLKNGRTRRQPRNREILGYYGRDGENEVPVGIEKNSKKRKTAEGRDEDNLLSTESGGMQILRRSKRNLEKSKDSILLTGQAEKRRKTGRNVPCGRKTALDNSSLVGGETGLEVDFYKEFLADAEVKSLNNMSTVSVDLKSVATQNGKVRSDGALVVYDNTKPTNYILEGVPQTDEVIRFSKQIGKVSPTKGPLRRSRRISMYKFNASTSGELGAHEIVGGNNPLMQLRETPVEEETNVTNKHPRTRSKKPLLEGITPVTENDPVIDKAPRRSARNASKGTSIVPAGLSGKAVKRKKQQSRSEAPSLEVEAPRTKKDQVINKAPRRSARNASKEGAVVHAGLSDKVVKRKKQKVPSLEVEAPPSESTLILEEAAFTDPKLSAPKTAGSLNGPVLSSTKKVPEDTKRKMGFRRMSQANEQPITVDLEEGNNKDGGPAPEDVELVGSSDQESHISVCESLVASEMDAVSMGLDKSNEDDKGGSSQHTREYSDNDSVVESELPDNQHQSGHVPAASRPKACSPAYRVDYVDGSASGMERGFEMETEEEPSTSPGVNPAKGFVVNLAAKDEPILNEQNLVEFEEPDRVDEPVTHQTFVDDVPGELNRSEGSSKESENATKEVIEIDKHGTSVGFIMVDLAAKGDTDSVCKEQTFVEFEEPERVEEPTILQSFVEDLDFESNERGGSKKEAVNGTEEDAVIDECRNSRGVMVNLAGKDDAIYVFKEQSLVEFKELPAIHQSFAKDPDGESNEIEGFMKGTVNARIEVLEIGEPGNSGEVVTLKTLKEREINEDELGSKSNIELAPKEVRVSGEFDTSAGKGATPHKLKEREVDEGEISSRKNSKNVHKEFAEVGDGDLDVSDGKGFTPHTFKKMEKNEDGMKTEENFESILKEVGVIGYFDVSDGEVVTPHALKEREMDEGEIVSRKNIKNAPKEFTEVSGGNFNNFDGKGVIPKETEMNEDGSGSRETIESASKEVGVVGKSDFFDQQGVNIHILKGREINGDELWAPNIWDPVSVPNAASADSVVGQVTVAQFTANDLCSAKTPPLKATSSQGCQASSSADQVVSSRSNLRLENDTKEQGTGTKVPGRTPCSGSTSVDSAGTAMCSSESVEEIMKAAENELEGIDEDIIYRPREESWCRGSIFPVLEKSGLQLSTGQKASHVVNEDALSCGTTFKDDQSEMEEYHVSHLFMTPASNADIIGKGAPDHKNKMTNGGRRCSRTTSIDNQSESEEYYVRQLLMTPASNTNIIRDKGTSDHETEMMNEAASQGDTLKGSGSKAFNQEKYEEAVETSKNEQVGIVNSANAAPSLGGDFNNEGRSLGAEIPGESESFSPSLADFFPEEGLHPEDEASEGLTMNCLVASEDGRENNMLGLSVEAENSWMASGEGDHEKARKIEVSGENILEVKSNSMQDLYELMALGIADCREGVQVLDKHNFIASDELICSRGEAADGKGNRTSQGKVRYEDNYSLAMAANIGTSLQLTVDDFAKCLKEEKVEKTVSGDHVDFICEDRGVEPHSFHSIKRFEHKDEPTGMNRMFLGSPGRIIRVDGGKILDEAGGTMLQKHDLKLSELVNHREGVDLNPDKLGSITPNKANSFECQDPNKEGNVASVTSNCSSMQNDFDGDTSLQVSSEHFAHYFAGDKVSDVNAREHDAILANACKSNRVEADAPVEMALNGTAVSSNTGGRTSLVKQTPLSSQKASTDRMRGLEKSAEVKLLADASNCRIVLCSASQMDVLSTCREECNANNKRLVCAEDFRESVDFENLYDVSSPKPTIATDCSAMSPLEYEWKGALEFDADSCILSKREISVFFGEGEGDEMDKSNLGESDINFAHDGSQDIKEAKEDDTVHQISKEQLGSCKEEEDATMNNTFLATSEEAVCEDGKAEEQKNVNATIKENVHCQNESHKSIEVKKSSHSPHKLILGETSAMNSCKHAASDEPTTDSKILEGSSVDDIVHAAVEYAKPLTASYPSGDGEAIGSNEDVPKPNLGMRDPCFALVGSPIDRVAVEDAQILQPRIESEYPRRKNGDSEIDEHKQHSVRKSDLSVKKSGKSRTCLAQRTPQRSFKMVVDMKENTPMIRREQMGNVSTTKTVTRRRALEDLQMN